MGLVLKIKPGNESGGRRGSRYAREGKGAGLCTCYDLCSLLRLQHAWLCDITLRLDLKSYDLTVPCSNACGRPLDELWYTATGGGCSMK